MSGVREDAVLHLDGGSQVVDSVLAQAVRPIVERVVSELDDTAVAVLVADPHAQLVEVRSPDPVVHRSMLELGLVPGACVGEDRVGTNAIGTPVETRQGLLVRGTEHYMTALHEFTCFGQPIIHPVTCRLAGVLDVGGYSGQDHRLYPQLARRMVRDIQERLQLDSPRAQRRLLEAFQRAAKRRGRAVVVVGEDLVLATPAALDLLEPADHAAVRFCAEGARNGKPVTHTIALMSGRVVRARCAPIDGVDGVLVDIVPEPVGARRIRSAATVSVAWPLLVVGEPGTGRSTVARSCAGADPVVVDAVDIVRHGEQPWAATTVGLLETDGPTVIIENIELLAPGVSMLVAHCLRDTGRHVVLTSAPGDHLGESHAPIAVLCDERRELIPLRHRRHEIPRLAQEMLDTATGFGRARLTTETLGLLAAQPWPGNLTELRRVIETVSAARSAGDILPADLPASHRNPPTLASPFQQAEREVIVTALAAAGGNRLRTARALGVSRTTLYNRMRALRID